MLLGKKREREIIHSEEYPPIKRQIKKVWSGTPGERDSRRAALPAGAGARSSHLPGLGEPRGRGAGLGRRASAERTSERCRGRRAPDNARGGPVTPAGNAERPPAARTQPLPPRVPAASVTRDPAGAGTARAAPRTRPAASAAASSSGPLKPMSRAPLPSAAH